MSYCLDHANLSVLEQSEMRQTFGYSLSDPMKFRSAIFHPNFNPCNFSGI